MTPLSKRRFVLGAAGSLAAPLAWARATPHGAAPVRLPTLDAAPGLAEWQAYLHQPFTLQTRDGSSHAVVLSRISAVGPASDEPALQQFVLGFAGTAGAHVPAGTYALRHANGQAAQLYLGDAGQLGQQQQLRAEFSLLTARA